MPKKLLKTIAWVLVGTLLIGSGPGTVSAQAAGPENSSEKTYMLTDLKTGGGYKYTQTVDASGVTALAYSEQYEEAFYDIPQEVLDAGLVGFRCETSSDLSGLAVKFRDNTNEELQVAYGNNYLEVEESKKDQIGRIGIMNLAGEENTILVSGITFFTENAVEAGTDNPTPDPDPNPEPNPDPNPNPAPDPNIISYTADQLNLHNRWNPGTVVDHALEFGAQYTEYCADLPEAVALSELESITIKVSDQSGALCFKLYDTCANNDGNVNTIVDPSYGNTGRTEYTLTPAGEGSIASIGIMSHDDKDTYPFSATIEGIEVKKKEASAADPNEKVYSGMTFYNRWNASDTQTGTIRFTEQYNEYRFDLPEALNMANCIRITVKVADQGGTLAFKLYDSADTEHPYYGKNGSTEYVLQPDFTGKATSFSVMATEEGEAAYPYEVKIESVTFSMTGESEEEELGDNLFKNSNFSDSDVSMWTAASGGAQVTAYSLDEDIIAELPGVKTYGGISGRTSNYECIAQDVTADMEKNAEYQYTFYAMLDAQDYASAPEAQRTVELSPMLTAGGETTYSQGVTGTARQVLEPGVWTKFSGTYCPSWTGDLESVVLRFLEQGENYGQGDGVKGRYYVTGFNLQKVIKEEVHIETDIVDLRDAMTEVMGSDFIVGTSICNSDLADDLEMQLVTKHFNAITLGNELKPDAMFGYAQTCPETEVVTINGQELVVPKLDYSRAEKTLNAIYEWNTAHPEDVIKVRGHVLVWHSQTPEWFFHEDYDASKGYVDAETMTLRQEWYIKSIAEHFTSAESKYKDMFYGWDVVNEAVSDGTGTYRSDSENSSWWAVYHSNEFITNAFVFANKYMPASVKLYYNDYNEWYDNKVKGIVQLLKDVKNTEGARIDGMGMQGHYQTSGTPSMDQFEKAARKYSEVVDEIMLTELDFKATDAYNGTAATQAAEDERTAARYKELYDTVRRLNLDGCKISGITVWGVVDKYSWLQTSSSVGGGASGNKVQCPLLFNNSYQAKKAFWALAEAGELTPVIKKPVLVQAVDDAYTAGNTYTFAKGTESVSFVPMWKSTGIRVKVTVPDASVEETDAVTLYVSADNGISTVTCKRSDSKEVTGGYEAELVWNDAAPALMPGGKFSFDLVVTDGANSYAYNDTTMNQAASSEFYAAATLKACAVVNKGTVTVDGKADDDAWKNAEEVALTINLNSTVSAFAKLLWDKEYLYVYTEVTDAVLNKDSADAYQQDSLEVFIDENNGKSGSYEEDDKQYRINYENEHSFNGAKCLEENMVSAAVLTETGYAIEAAFKWTDIVPAKDSLVGLELQINDAGASGSRLGTLSWSDATGLGWSAPEVFGVIVLADDSTSEPTPEPAPEPAPAPAPTPTVAPTPKPAVSVAVTYVVAKGDSLYAIAARNNMTLAELISLNPQIKNPALIYPGQEIILGHKTADAPEADQKGTSDSAAEYYIVVKGDCLYAIARRNGMTVVELERLNALLFKQKYIFVGQKVRIR